MGNYRKYKKYKKNNINSKKSSENKEKSNCNLYVDKNLLKEKKKDIFLACFWRYGYWLCLLIAIWKFATPKNSGIILGGFSIVFGIYTMIISIIPARHFLLGMLDAEHKRMRLAGSGYNQRVLEKWQGEAWLLAAFFIFMGAILVIIGQ